MARTGERYMTARRHVVEAVASPDAAEPRVVDDHGYRLRGGVHPETAAIANVAANLGVTAAHTGAPLSEAMVLGAGYILWEFQAHHQVRVLTLGFRNSWQYPDRWAAKTMERLGLPGEMLHTGGHRAAAAQLDTALGRGRPAIAWIDPQLLGYWHLPSFLEGHTGYPVVVHGADGDRVRIDDRNVAPLTVARDTLAAARGRVGSFRNRLVVLEPTDPIPEDRLRAAATAGLEEMVEHLSRSSDSFSLPAWRTWARLLIDTRNAKAWPKVFADPNGLVGTLVSAYEDIEPIGMYGGNLRGLFAEFLDEAAGLLDAPLAGLAERYREIAAAWHDLAEATLPLHQPDLATIRDLLAAVQAHVVGEGDDGAAAAAQASSELWALRGRWRKDSPFQDPTALFGDLSARLQAIYAAETAALEDLRALQERQDG